ncbi:MAG: hypothetical protein LBR22_08840 [Desulfovibrio sp.]|nr:hypothetical protein [Desulfovibrio sp.]
MGETRGDRDGPGGKGTYGVFKKKKYAKTATLSRACPSRLATPVQAVAPAH